MTVSPWLRLLLRHHFAVSPGRVPMAFMVTLLSLANSAAAAVQRARWSRELAAAAVDPPPLFIIGHWRTGTTLLHELLALDPQFRCPTTYECMAPAHFLLTRDAVTRHLGGLLPPHRPLDAMRLRWHLPQEDEFALMSLGMPSPYEALAFPRTSPAAQAALDPRAWAEADRLRWQQALDGFLRIIALSGRARPVLKGPCHTARLGLLAEMYPGAIFIHTVRRPEEMVASFLIAWRRLVAAVGLQTRLRPDFDGRLLDLGAALYRRFEADRESLSPARLIEVRFEDLSADPAAVLDRIYAAFGMPHRDRIPDMVRSYRQAVGDYRPLRPSPPEALRPAITARWGAYADRYGYRPGPS